MDKIKEFLNDVKGYGFTAFLAGGIALLALIFGYTHISAFCVGIFATRNWDIISEYITKHTGINL